MSNDHRTITFTEIDVEIEEESEDELAFPVSSVTIEETVVEEEEEDEDEVEEAVVEDIEGEDPELVIHAKEIEEQQSGLRKFQPPSSLQLGQKAKDVVFKDGKDAIGAGAGKARKQSTAQQSSSDIGVFDFDIDFDLDKAEDIVDYSVYENRTGLAEDMKFLASMPE